MVELNSCRANNMHRKSMQMTSSGAVTVQLVVVAWITAINLDLAGANSQSQGTGASSVSYLQRIPIGLCHFEVFASSISNNLSTNA